jgi:hypothetical protein
MQAWAAERVSVQRHLGRAAICALATDHQPDREPLPDGIVATVAVAKWRHGAPRRTLNPERREAVYSQRSRRQRFRLCDSIWTTFGVCRMTAGLRPLSKSDNRKSDNVAKPNRNDDCKYNAMRNGSSASSENSIRRSSSGQSLGTILQMFRKCTFLVRS